MRSTALRLVAALAVVQLVLMMVATSTAVSVTVVDGKTVVHGGKGYKVHKDGNTVTVTRDDGQVIMQSTQSGNGASSSSSVSSIGDDCAGNAAVVSSVNTVNPLAPGFNADNPFWPGFPFGHPPAQFVRRHWPRRLPRPLPLDIDTGDDADDTDADDADDTDNDDADDQPEAPLVKPKKRKHSKTDRELQKEVLSVIRKFLAEQNAAADDDGDGDDDADDADDADAKPKAPKHKKKADEAKDDDAPEAKKDADQQPPPA